MMKNNVDILLSIDSRFFTSSCDTTNTSNINLVPFSIYTNYIISTTLCTCLHKAIADPDDKNTYFSNTSALKCQSGGWFDRKFFVEVDIMFFSHFTSSFSIFKKNFSHCIGARVTVFQE